MKPEQRARQKIDQLLEASGWIVKATFQLVESQQQAGSLLYIEPPERMRQSILKQAFLGELVPQDPSDEPAALLLERIKSKRAEREAEKRAVAKRVTKRVRQAASLSRA